MSRRNMQWDEKMSIFTEYYLKHGLPTTNYNKSVLYKSVNLTTWWATQCKYMRDGKMPQYRIDRLAEIGIDMNKYQYKTKKERWNDTFDAFVKYYNLHGIPTTSLVSPALWDGTNVSSFWCNSKYAYNKDNLPEWKLEKFIALGLSEDDFTGSSNCIDRAWDDNYNRAYDYLISGKSFDSCDGGKQLRSWMHSQGLRYKNGQMPEYRRYRFEVLLAMRKK